MNTIPCGVCSFENRDVYLPPTIKTINHIANSPSHSSESKAILLRNLTEMRHELEKIDTEIELTSAALSRMSITRHRILSSMQQHDKSLRPILSIPDDVLRLIFEWSVIFCPDMRGDDLLDPRVDSPWTLSHTCHHWRTVAISHSILWRDILMPPDEKGMLLLELSLQRSANAGLDIDIQSHDTLDIFATEVFMVMEAKRCRLCIVNQEKEDYTGARLSVDVLENYRALKERGMITTDVNYDFDFF